MRLNFCRLSRAAGWALAGIIIAACGSPSAPKEAATATLPPAGVTIVAPTQPSQPTAAPATEAAQPTTAPPPSASPPTGGSEGGTPPGQIGPANFPPDVNPLTGQTLDEAALNRIPVAIKVANSPEVRPQYGLSKADVVFEHFAEGGITRFTAVFLGQEAEQVGSVRSGRLLDLEIPNMFQAILAYSGASVGVNQKMRAANFYDRIETPDFGRAAPFWRDDNLPVPHNLFTSADDLRADAQARGVNVGRQDLRGWAFSETPPSGGQPAKQVTLSYNVSYVLWFYQAGFGKYYRWNDGVEHTDRATGEQLTAANVVVLYANHVCDWSIVEDSYNPQANWYSIQIQIWGGGPAKIFRDGQAYDVKWVRNAPTDLIGFVDANNDVFTLKPGNTWIQLVQLDSPTKQDGEASWDVDPKEPGCVKAAGAQ